MQTPVLISDLTELLRPLLHERRAALPVRIVLVLVALVSYSRFFRGEAQVSRLVVEIDGREWVLTRLPSGGWGWLRGSRTHPGAPRKTSWSDAEIRAAYKRLVPQLSRLRTASARAARAPRAKTPDWASFVSAHAERAPIVSELRLRATADGQGLTVTNAVDRTASLDYSPTQVMTGQFQARQLALSILHLVTGLKPSSIEKKLKP